MRGEGGAIARRLRRQAVGCGGSEACGVFDGYKVEIGGTKTNEKFVITNVCYYVIIKIKTDCLYYCGSLGCKCCVCRAYCI